jgi:4-alpha-glucanotransferase
MAHPGRLSGILLPVFSLRRRGDFGIGDFGAVPGLFAWMRRAEQRMLMVLPLLPTAPNDTSPYATRCAFGLNPLLIDLDQVPEYAEQGGLGSLSAPERAQLESVQQAASIQYGPVLALKTAVLKRAFDRFFQTEWEQGGAGAAALKRYIEREASWLDGYALFTTLSAQHELRPWWEWPEPLRDRQPAAMAREVQRSSREILFRSWLQWVAEEQWGRVRAEARKAGVLLCGDEPFILGQDSADVWMNPGLLRRDARLGVPPDAFSAEGQDWGLPYYDFAAMEAEDFRWMRRRARKSADYYDLRRVDHAVGYFRQYIRDERTPRGRFVPGDEPAQQALGEKLFKVLSEGAGTVAEDLGVIPPFVTQTLERLGIPGYKVMRWERDPWGFRDPRRYPRVSLCTTGTHDTETLREWWLLLKPEEKGMVAAAYEALHGLREPGAFSPQIHRALLATAEDSASDLCVLPWQDVLGSDQRINMPGLKSEANWTYRIDQDVEDLLQDETTRGAAEMLAGLTRKAGRAAADPAGRRHAG